MIQYIIDRLIASINKKHKQKKEDIINLKDPKARKVVNKYKKKLEKSSDKIMRL